MHQVHTDDVKHVSRFVFIFSCFFSFRNFCSLHDVTSSVIYYSTHTRKNVIYLLNNIQSVVHGFFSKLKLNSLFTALPFQLAKIAYLNLNVSVIINMDLKQARTVTAVNKQLNFTVKNKPHTTSYIYCIFEAYFMIKNVLMKELY